MRTYVYIDGFNLYYAIRNTGCKWLNLKALADQVMPAGSNVECVKYYTARVSGATDPAQPGRQQVYLSALMTLPEVQIFYGSFLAKAQWRPILNLPVADRLMNGKTSSISLASEVYAVDMDPTLPRCTPESLPVDKYGNGSNGKPAPLPDAVKVQIFAMEEKGSDVNLAVHLVHDAWAKRFDAAAVISNDTDLVEPIRIVTEELRIPVYLLSPPATFDAPKALKAVATSVRRIKRSHLKAAIFADTLTRRDGKKIIKPAGW